MKRVSSNFISLIEVLTALTILGVLMIIILSGFSYNIRSTQLVEGVQQANFVLLKKIKEFEYKENLIVGVYHGEEELDDKKFQWFANIRQERFDSLLEVDIKVEYIIRGEKRELKEFVLLPIRSKGK